VGLGCMGPDDGGLLGVASGAGTTEHGRIRATFCSLVGGWLMLAGSSSSAASLMPLRG